MWRPHLFFLGSRLEARCVLDSGSGGPCCTLSRERALSMRTCPPAKVMELLSPTTLSCPGVESA